MRNSLIVLLLSFLLAACSDQPGDKERKGAHPDEHTVEQSAEQAGAAMDAAGEEVDVVTESIEEAEQTVVEEAEAAAGDAAEQVELAADGVTGREPQEIYNTYCMACHVQGVAGAPKLDDTQAWQQRIDERGRDMLVQNAINGYKAMPAKGACRDCSDEEIRGTVDWMLQKAGI